MKKILVITDLKMETYPFFRNLRYSYPNSQIDVLLNDKDFVQEKECCYVNNIFKKLPKNKNYEKAYVLNKSFKSSFLAFCSGANVRIGFGKSFLLTQKVLFEQNKPEQECYLDILRKDNLKVYDNYLE